jgi:hypothetical protein
VCPLCHCKDQKVKTEPENRDFVQSHLSLAIDRCRHLVRLLAVPRLWAKADRQSTKIAVTGTFSRWGVQCVACPPSGSHMRPAFTIVFSPYLHLVNCGCHTGDKCRGADRDVRGSNSASDTGSKTAWGPDGAAWAAKGSGSRTCADERRGALFRTDKIDRQKKKKAGKDRLRQDFRGDVLAFLPTGETVDGVTIPASAVVRWQDRAWVYQRTEPEKFVRVEIATDSRRRAAVISSPACRTTSRSSLAARNSSCPRNFARKSRSTRTTSGGGKPGDLPAQDPKQI